MPNQVYYFQLRGRNIGGNVRMESKEQADETYKTIAQAVTAEDKFVEVKLGDGVSAVRVQDISAFGLEVRLEPTREEIIEQERKQFDARISQNYDVGVCGTNYAYQGEAKLVGYSGGLI